MIETGINSSLSIVDVTVRDGGYANNYSFSSEEVFSLARSLELCGIEMIEIGHGYGLGAERTLGKMAEPEANYIDKLAGQLKLAKFGMFANANIAKIEDIKSAARAGLNFVRIGSIGFDGPHPINVGLELLSEAKKNGLWASINLVRSQRLTFRELELAAKLAKENGADAIYIVDSTGGMFPSQAADIVRVMRMSTDLRVGFHGHENLGLGLANTLAAHHSGATFLDGTLGGIGRESGNVQLELLVAALRKSGVPMTIDPFKLFGLTEMYIAPTMGQLCRVSRHNLALGFYDMFSHGMELAVNLAEKHNVPLELALKQIYSDKPNFETEEVILKSIKQLL